MKWVVAELLDRYAKMLTNSKSFIHVASEWVGKSIVYVLAQACLRNGVLSSSTGVSTAHCMHGVHEYGQFLPLCHARDKSENYSQCIVAGRQCDAQTIEFPGAYTLLGKPIVI